MLNKLKLTLPLILSILITLLITHSVFAIEELGDDGGAPGANTGIDLGTYLRLSNDTPIKEVYSQPAFLVNLIVRNLMIVGGMMVLVLALIVGYKYITGGKKALQDINQITLWGLIGFLIMFGAYWIVQIIKLITGVDIIL